MLKNTFLVIFFLFVETFLLCVTASTQLRNFSFSLPLFSSSSPWNQKVTNATVMTQSDQQILTLYQVLRGDTTGFPRQQQRL